MKKIVKNEKETEKLAEKFASELCGGEIVLLQGNLGAGKSFFVRSLARVLGVKNRITSPTFVLMKVYPVKKKNFLQLVHVDAYRIEIDDLLQVGLDEYLNNPQAVVFIEWGEKIMKFLDDNKYNYQMINIDILGVEKRSFSFG